MDNNKNLYMNLGRSRDGTLFGCSGVCYLRVRFGQLLRCSHKRIVDVMKVYIERNNMQVELMPFRKKCRLYSHTYIHSSIVNPEGSMVQQ